MLQKHLLLTLALCIFSYVRAQEKQTLKNLNPDPNGTPWYVSGFQESTGAKLLDAAEIERLKSHNQLKSSYELPSAIDNADNKFMRTPFSQAGGSCGSASRICYMFAYETNCFRNVDGDLKENKYPSHFTWLLTYQGSGKEGMAMSTGIPNAVTYEGDIYSTKYGGNVASVSATTASDYGWMNGYDRWYSAMNNRLLYNGVFQLTSPKNLNLLKEWIFNHWGDNTFHAGGVAGAGCAITGASYVKADNGKDIVNEWGPRIDHGTTWCGYDDNVGYDFNSDGKITNDIDTNGDGVVNMLDWERGALIMLNSWGPDWKNQGRVYVPYRLLKKNNMGAELYFIRKNYKPVRTMKITMNYSARCDVKLSVGVASDLNATEPERTLACDHFKFAGFGKVPMLGKWADGAMHTEDMEFGYDITDLTRGFDATKPLKYFLKVETAAESTGTGKVVGMSVLNYDGDTPVETKSSQTNVNIANGGQTTYVSVAMTGGEKINYAEKTEKKLEGYWAFDEISGTTASDKSGNKNDGTLMGNASWNSNGKFGGAISLDGSGDWIDIDDISINGDFTIAAWVNFKGTISHMDGIVSDDDGIIGGINFYAGRPRLYDRLNKKDRIVASSVIKADVWTHVAITREGGQLKMYINGNLDATSSNYYDKVFVAGALGRSSAVIATNGMLDELRIYSGALTSEEINQLQAASLATDIKQTKLEADFNLYPNPVVSSQFNLWSSAFSNTAKVEIFSLNGQLMQSQMISELAVSGQVTVKLTKPLKGIYLVRVSDKDKSKIKKVIFR